MKKRTSPWCPPCPAVGRQSSCRLPSRLRWSRSCRVARRSCYAWRTADAPTALEVRAGASQFTGTHTYETTDDQPSGDKSYGLIRVSLSGPNLSRSPHSQVFVISRMTDVHVSTMGRSHHVW